MSLLLDKKKNGIEWRGFVENKIVDGKIFLRYFQTISFLVVIVVVAAVVVLLFLLLLGLKI